MKNKPNIKGFSLVELLVVIIILATIIGIAFFAINPVEQLNKARNSQREQDLHTIKTALDAYYNDHGCYPNAIPFGSIWIDTSGVTPITYMKLVPQDPACYSGGNCYYYQVDLNSQCAQWNVLYGSLPHVASSANNKTFCALESIGQCIPGNYGTLGFNYCVLSGSVDCAMISQSLLPTPGPPIVSVPTPTPTPTPTILPGSSPTPTPNGPTPTPFGQGCASPNFACTAVNSANPLGVCNDVGPDGAPGATHYCGFPGCSGNGCCEDACSQ